MRDILNGDMDWESGQPSTAQSVHIPDPSVAATRDTDCFRSRPEIKRRRRSITIDEQKRITLLRLKGAGIRCRIMNIKVGKLSTQ